MQQERVWTGHCVKSQCRSVSGAATVASQLNYTGAHEECIENGRRCDFAGHLQTSHANQPPLCLWTSFGGSLGVWRMEKSMQMLSLPGKTRRSELENGARARLAAHALKVALTRQTVFHLIGECLMAVLFQKYHVDTSLFNRQSCVHHHEDAI